MSNASLKDQLKAVAAKLGNDGKSKRNVHTNVHMKDKSKKPKPRWLEYVQYGVELLKAYFPEGFKSNNEVKPLKKGIKQDLVKRLSGIDSIVIEDKACMLKSLAYYVNTAAYHKSVIEGATRIDLDGAPAGTVTNEEAKYSTERHQAKQQAKHAVTSSSRPAPGPSSQFSQHQEEVEEVR